MSEGNIAERNCIREVLGVKFGRGSGYSEWAFSWFSQSLQENSVIEPWFYHDRLLPNPFQYIIHLSSYNPSHCSLATENVVKYPRFSTKAMQSDTSFNSKKFPVFHSMTYDTPNSKLIFYSIVKWPRSFWVVFWENVQCLARRNLNFYYCEENRYKFMDRHNCIIKLIISNEMAKFGAD